MHRDRSAFRRSVYCGKMNEEISEVRYQYVRELFFTDREEMFREIASLAGYRQRFLYYYCRLACETYEKYQRAGIGDRVFLTPSPILLSGARYVSEDMGNTGFRNMNGCGVMWK